jgi:hypothetical protein
MAVMSQYFEMVAALLGVYGVFRLIIWWEFRNGFCSTPPSAPSTIQGHTIDTSHFADRLEKIRHGYATEAHPPSSMKPLLVEERRAEIAKLAFFQRPPPAELPEPEHRLFLLAL